MISLLFLAPIAACTLSPPGGAVVAKDRRYPELAVGKSGIVIVHQTRRQKRSVFDLAPRHPGLDDAGLRGDSPDCEWADGAVALRFPLGATPPLVLRAVDKTSSACVGDIPDPVRLAVVSGEPVAVACSYPVNLAWECSIKQPFAERPLGPFGFSERSNETAIAAAFAGRGDSLLGVAVGRSGALTSFRAQPGTRAMTATLVEALPPALLDAETSQVALVPGGVGNAVAIVWGGDAPALQIALDTSGKRNGKPRTAPPGPPLPDGVSASVERVARPGDKAWPRVVLRTFAGTRPIEGLDATRPTFSPQLVKLSDGTALLAWSEGLKADTRVKVARIDLAGARLTSAPVELSSAGHEGGYVALGASAGGRVVVAWDEKDDGGWEIRAAELSCAAR